MLHDPNRLPPPRLARLVERVRDRLSRLYRGTVPPEVALLELVTAGWLSQAVCAAAELGIADVLANGPLDAPAIARALGCDASAVYRLLRALAQHGVFRHEPDGRFAQSPLSAALRTDAPGSLRSFARYVGHPAARAHWSALDGAVRSGEPAVPALRGMPFFAYTQADPAFGAVFNDAMTSIADLAERAVLAAYDVTQLGTVVDVGGGQGRLLAGLLARAPEARGVLFDLPEVVAGAPLLLGQRGVRDRCIVEAGSFFERAPTGGDTYVLKHILHDWDDERALVILHNLRDAMRSGARLVIIESVLPEGAAPHFGTLQDLEMLVSVGGKERTEADFRALLEQARFTLARVVPTASPLSVLEASAR